MKKKNYIASLVYHVLTKQFKLSFNGEMKGGMPLARLQLRLPTWEGGGKVFKPVGRKGKTPVPQFPLAKAAV